MDELRQYLEDLFADFGSVTIKRMFGGMGVFFRGLMFALVDAGELYLKADDDLATELKALGSKPFTYERQGKRIALGYMQAPAEAMEDPATMAVWAERAFTVARAADNKKGR